MLLPVVLEVGVQGMQAHFKSLICPNSAKISNSDTGFSTFFDNINELTRCFQYKEKFIMA